MQKKYYNCSCGTQITITRYDDDLNAATRELEKAVGEHIAEKHKRLPTTLALDAGDSPACEGEQSPEVLSAGEADSTPPAPVKQVR